MNLYALTTRFWQENDYESMPASAIALYFYLLYRANARHWSMPVRCPTSMVCRALGISRQTLVTAREELKRRGFINFTPGFRQIDTPGYTLIDLTSNLTSDLTSNLTSDLTSDLTSNLTSDLTSNLTIYNIKDKDKDKSTITTKAEKKLNLKLDLDTLEPILLADTQWQEQAMALLAGQYSIAPDELPGRIVEFFKFLRCNGVDGHTEQDCRSHFINWISKRLKNTPNNDKPKYQDSRRSSAVTAKSASDYDGAF